MKVYIFIVCLILNTFTIRAQSHDVAIADIDLDTVADTLTLDRKAGVIISKLSGQKFRPRTTRPMQSLHSEDFEFIALTALPGSFQLLFLADNSSCYFGFVFDQKRKRIYLAEYWAESRGDEIGRGAYEFDHNLRGSYVNYWVRRYNGATEGDRYNPTAFNTDRGHKHVRRLRMRFERFSDERYYKKIDYIRKDIVTQ